MAGRDQEGKSVAAVLFDVDGTLVDSNDLHAEAWRRAFADFGIDLPFDTVRGQIGKGGDNLIPSLAPDLSETRRRELEAYRSNLFKRDYLPQVAPFPCIRALFERLDADDIRIVLASSSAAEEVDHHLGLIGAADLVTATTSRDDVESSKPCPDIFEAAMAKVAPLAADDLIVVGDTPWDAKAAARLGLRTIGFRCGGFPEVELVEAGACALYDDARHLLADYERSVFAGRG
ncbi:HAD family hydrolase [Sphingosinicella rhizophila]|uniref:HAD family phosphatase n=1 Tax=Sphingosinicella rhizophila TaxID=3050082 RepID=A0ABU3Q771_9SPHN|nr:HAD family phosphatase [Sphingosinicella sp. GR2756]MDT9599255.1 HAD family phosphatase [Sphingosinicella sp. GR2756]